MSESYGAVIFFVGFFLGLSLRQRPVKTYEMKEFKGIKKT
jgi:hypothetical protein